LKLLLFEVELLTDLTLNGLSQFDGLIALLLGFLCPPFPGCLVGVELTP
jgi:hypothetical protein